MEYDVPADTSHRHESSYDTSAARKPASACAVGRRVIHNFLVPPVDLGVVGMTVVMSDVVRQEQEEYRTLVEKMCSGTMVQTQLR